MNYDRILDEAFRALEDTAVYVPPSYPPPADERAETHRYLPAVPEFFGTRCCWPATSPVPAHSQHASTCAFESYERTLDIPHSDVRAVPSTHRQQLVDTPAHAAPGALVGATCTSGVGQGVPSGAP